MKKIFLASTLLGLAFFSSGQYNAQLIDSAKTWSIANQP